MSSDYPEIGHIWDLAELLRGDYKRSDYVGDDNQEQPCAWLPPLL